mmetsp:Transcript_7591/g.18659  ORF Transcript_7591/g.18659 Transcript_7591/m.18659 type:complete len:785 (-) Transcript_7591:72-2426(-)
MRVLLAGRFRGISNAAQLLEEEGEESLVVLEEEEEEEKKEEEAVVDEQSSNRGQAQVQVQAQAQAQALIEQGQTRSLKSQNHQIEPRDDTLLITGKENRGDKRTSQQPLSVPSPQHQAPLPQRKRRLANSTPEGNDSTFRRRKASASSTEEDPSFLDRKPRARENQAVTGLAHFDPDLNPKKDSISREVDRSSIIPVPLTTIESIPTERNGNKMVSGGPGRNHHSQHGNPCEGDQDENLLNWQYSNHNHHPNHAVSRRLPVELDRGVVHSDREIFIEPSSSAGFNGPLENDPASARGDVSSSSPERQNHGNRYNPGDPTSVIHVQNSGFVVGRREDSPSLVLQNSYGLDRIASAPRILPTSNSYRQERSRIDHGAGSERETSVLKTNNLNRGYGKNKTASTPAEELRFREVLKKERGLEIREQDGDGNCLFRAISLQVYGDPSMHGDVRKQCMDHMERDQEHFSQFVSGEPFLQYVARTRQDGVHGNNPEIQAISELFNRPIEVFTPENGSSPLNIFHAEYKTGDVPIRLSYHDGNHYNAVIDPLMPTAGLGLGLPGLKPGYADKMQMAKAVAESIDAAAGQDEMDLQQVLKASQLEYNESKTDNEDDLQRAIKESQLSAEHMSSKNALSLSDMDATYFELEQAALERSLQSYSQKEEGKKQRASTTVSRSSIGDSSKPNTIRGDHKAPAIDTTATSFTTASLPCPSQESIPLAAAAPSSSHNEASSSPTPPQRLLPVEEYPSSVQELVMNGFPLSKVVKAFELVGNNFDHMLSLCIANTNSSS